MMDALDINLRHLRALPLIADHGSMSAAAEMIGLSQPALSQGLSKLEAVFGAALFERNLDGMVATPAGARVVQRARAALAHLSRATRACGRTDRRGFARPENLLTATQLRGLLSLADAGSFVGAAQATGLSQPALHRAVRDVEQLCAAPLVERRGRGVALTAAGRGLARGFRLAIAELTAALQEAGQETRAGGRICIGAMPLCRAVLLPQAITQLARANPGAKIDIVEGAYQDLVEPLRDGRIDLMIGALRDPSPSDLEQRALFTDQLIVTARAGHPLAKTASPALADLALYPWIIGRAGTPLRGQWEVLFDANGLSRPEAPIECGSVMTIRGLLRENDFLTLLSPDQVAVEIDSGLLIQVGRPLAATLRTIGVTWRRDWRPPPLQSQFLDLLCEAVGSSGIPKNQ